MTFGTVGACSWLCARAARQGGSLAGWVAIAGLLRWWVERRRRVFEGR
jgi:hypothetical protein